MYYTRWVTSLIGNGAVGCCVIRPERLQILANCTQSLHCQFHCFLSGLMLLFFKQWWDMVVLIFTAEFSPLKNSANRMWRNSFPTMTSHVLSALTLVHTEQLIWTGHLLYSNPLWSWLRLWCLFFTVSLHGYIYNFRIAPFNCPQFSRNSSKLWKWRTLFKCD